MVFLELLRVSLGALWANKLRSGLTILGNVIGVLTVIAVVSLIQGLNRYVAAQFTQQGSDSFFIVKIGLMTSQEDFLNAMHRRDLTVEDAQAIKEQCPAIRVVSVSTKIPGTVKYGHQTLQNVWIVGETGDFEEATDIPIGEGRYPSTEDNDHRRMVAAIGVELQDNLFGSADPVGRSIRVKNIDAQIVGVAERRGSFFGQSKDNFVVIPISIYEQYIVSRKDEYFGRSLAILAKARDQKLLEVAEDEAAVVLRSRRHVRPGKPNDFDIMSGQNFVDLFNNFTRVAWIVMVGIASISLVVGGIVIMNIMLVSVTERTREIGIRKAIGARQSDILKQFLVEAATLGMLGGLVGVVLGALAAKIISATTPLPSVVELWSVLVGLGVASSVGIVFGLYPAWKAAKLDPIEALRYE